MLPFYGPKRGILEIGINVFIGDWCTISARSRVVIGDDCLIAERVTIRDQDHAVSTGELAHQHAGYMIEPVQIGNNVWIGVGVLVLRGSTIGDGVVIGANAVVKSNIGERRIAVGMPAKAVRQC